MNSGMTQIWPTTNSLSSNRVGDLIGLGLRVGQAASSSRKNGKNNNTLVVVEMKDRSNNRKPLQKGRNLSIEAIQTVQALKRVKANSSGPLELEPALETSFRRLLKLDMLAVLRELIRQNQCYLALKVFEEIQKEHWYKPQISLYAELISLLGSNGSLEEVEIIFIKLKKEHYLEPDIKGFNALLENLANFNLTGLAVECFHLMKSTGCDLDKLSYKILINGLESNGEASLSAILQLEAEKYFGQSLNFQGKED